MTKAERDLQNFERLIRIDEGMKTLVKAQEQDEKFKTKYTPSLESIPELAKRVNDHERIVQRGKGILLVGGASGTGLGALVAWLKGWFG